jgi:hypothetical protein
MLAFACSGKGGAVRCNSGLPERRTDLKLKSEISALQFIHGNNCVTDRDLSWTDSVSAIH